MAAMYTGLTGVGNTGYTGAAMSDFRFGLGHVTLDFLATLGRPAGDRIERLTDPSDLDRWIAEAGIAAAPRASGQLLDDARELREAIRRVLDCARSGGRPRAADLRFVNEWARGPVAAPQIGPGFERVSVGPDPVTGALAHIARESVDLVTSPELARVRTCAGCTLLFIDRSRPGTRRWCSMDRCGNRNKTTHYRQKRHAST
jgi:predicted RNA-binding Zn ribbon-like protein